MPVATIVLLRHGHRLAWTLDPATGTYSSNHPYPTRLPADPPLASHGVSQAEETGAYLSKELLSAAREGRLRVYSSLFYRCLQTLAPTVEGLRDALEAEGKGLGEVVKVRGERGFSEWFGKAWFEQPVPLDTAALKEGWFPWLDEGYESLVVPERKGERITELHERLRTAWERVVEDVDKEEPEKDVVLLVAGHAAQIIASGRALTGRTPSDLDEDDFQCFTCGLSRFERRQTPDEGVGGGFECVVNSDCGHLSQGEERGWRFNGDESFDSYAECQNKPIAVHGGSREPDAAKL